MFGIWKMKEKLCTVCAEFFWRRHPDLNRGIKVLQTLALPLGYSALFLAPKRKKRKIVRIFGAGNEIRTRDIHLGKVTLYH